jgi:hypothetical protein
LIEFTTDLNSQYYDKSAIVPRVQYRLGVLKGEIPYFAGGFDIKCFTYNIAAVDKSLKDLLKDMSPEVTISGGRVTVADVVIDVAKGLQQ